MRPRVDISSLGLMQGADVLTRLSHTVRAPRTLILARAIYLSRLRNYHDPQRITIPVWTRTACAAAVRIR